MSTGPRQVVDVNGTRYALGRQLGRGGQGAVYEVEGGRLAAKLVFDRSPSRRERLRNQLAQVRRLPIEDLDIVRPLERLRDPHVGYVMERLTGMVPLGELARAPRDVSLVPWYFSGGGLRRRLRLLGRVAELLAQLHGRGLVYADPSPHNAFVSGAREDHEVRLIDADNLHHQSAPGAPGIYTPGYGAPELVTGRGAVNTLTDTHAFAVIAFRVLAQVHPLLGDAVAFGDPEREEEALAGRLPWVDAPEDDSNRTSSGIPRALVLSERLKELFQQTFGPGLLQPMVRPGVASWAERLHAAADATLDCGGCGGTFYERAEACPWCDEVKGPHVLAHFFLSDPAVLSCKACGTRYPVEDATCPGCREPRPPDVGRASLVRQPDARRRRMARAVVTERLPLLVTERLISGRIGKGSHVPRVEARLEGDRLVLRSLDGAAYSLSSSSGARSDEVGERSTRIRLEPRQESWRLHLGELSRPHRIVGFELRTGGAA
jgi:hypothetical protein